jgi:choline dehydrogenase-like flavoprotein
MPTFDSDVCIIGSGLSSAMLTEKLAERSPGLAITVVEAGSALFDTGNRIRYRQRSLDYDESAWPGDIIEDQLAEGIICHTMAVGGQALRWGGACNRFSQEDLRLKSLYGLAADWPLPWEELEKAYCEAERRLYVAGEPSPYPEDARSEPYPRPPVPMSYNTMVLRKWAEQGGFKWVVLPVSRNVTPTPDGRGTCCVFDTCTSVCPTGARYSPDWTFKRLLSQKKIVLHDRTLVRKLVLHDSNPTIVAAHGVHQDRPGEVAEYRARLFVLAAGYAWSPHLLLLSACSRFPEGLANSAGLVGRYMNGHKFFNAQATIDTQIYSGLCGADSLLSREYLRCPTDQPYVRHDLRVWESAVGRRPRLRDEKGQYLFGDQLMEDWRTRVKGGTVRLRSYYDVHPSIDSRLTLSPARKNRYGDPLPKIEHRFDEATLAREERVQQHIRAAFDRLVCADNGKILSTSVGTYLDHPGGGCRMGADPASSVCDGHGRTHDHENLFVVGAPTTPTAGCINGALTFAALALRSADRILEVLRGH